MRPINYVADVALLLVTCGVVTYFFNKYASWRERHWLVMTSVWIGTVHEQKLTPFCFLLFVCVTLCVCAGWLIAFAIAVLVPVDLLSVR